MTTQESNPPKPMTVAKLEGSPAIPVDHRLFYGPDPSQFGDLYLPRQTGPHPVVIVVHGGCWWARVGLDYLGELCKAFTGEGFAVWNVEYRRLGNGGGWPMTFLDVARSADFLRELAEIYALNLSRVVAVGHSAGGHLALWLAGRHRLPTDSPLYTRTPLPLGGVVSLAGVGDLVEEANCQLCGGACQELMGGSPEAEWQRYRQGSPKELLPLGVTQWHIVGSAGLIVPVDTVQQYVTVAAQYDPVQLDILPDVGHFEFSAPASPAWPAVRHAVHTLLAKA
jgi:pimeloyl-ACP methyl ester carboxylesterase